MSEIEDLERDNMIFELSRAFARLEDPEDQMDQIEEN